MLNFYCQQAPSAMPQHRSLIMTLKRLFEVRGNYDDIFEICKCGFNSIRHEHD